MPLVLVDCECVIEQLDKDNTSFSGIISCLLLISYTMLSLWEYIAVSLYLTQVPECRVQVAVWQLIW